MDYLRHGQIEVIKVLLVVCGEVAGAFEGIVRQEILFEKLPHNAKVVRRAVHHEIGLTHRVMTRQQQQSVVIDPIQTHEPQQDSSDSQLSSTPFEHTSTSNSPCTHTAWNATHRLKLCRGQFRAVIVLHHSDKLSLLRVAHRDNPVSVCRCGTSIQLGFVVQVIVAVVRHKDPVPTSVTVLCRRTSRCSQTAISSYNVTCQHVEQQWQAARTQS